MPQVQPSKEKEKKKKVKVYDETFPPPKKSIYPGIQGTGKGKFVCGFSSFHASDLPITMESITF